MEMETFSLVSAGEWVALVVCALVCFTAAALGALTTKPQIETWYVRLRKPSWTPPAWVFGPVWSSLYPAMAVAVWLVWRRAGWQDGRLELTLFALQLVLNSAWSFIFFRFHSLGWAFVEIVALWMAIGTTIVTFVGVSQLSALLLIPYFAWVCFAAALNLAIWRMNE